MRWEGRLIATFGIAALVCGVPSSAQTVVPPGMLTLDGFTAQCGAAPTFLVGNELNDLAKANSTGIYLNIMALSGLPSGVKLFVYAHECGHYLYGPNENTADQFGIQIGKIQGWISPATLSQICGTVIMSPGDWTHLPGPARCSNMIGYYASL